jgi:hypothetical protein
MAFDISVTSNIKELRKSLSAFVERQIPFAIATALTATAKKVQQGEVAQLKATFHNPKPFTLNSVGMKAARKDTLTATVFVKPIAEKYLTPYETGGLHELPGNALLNPKNIKLDQYGQLPKNILAKLKARPDIFIGPVKTSSGTVNAVWQRPYYRDRDTTGDIGRVNKVVGWRTLKSGRVIKVRKLRGTRNAHTDAWRKSGVNTTGHLVLIIRFGDALAVNKHLGYRARAQAIVAANFDPEFKKAFAQAMATAK